jgi:hypothetical protein
MNNYAIVDEPLPEALNFEALKRLGIDQLKVLAGKVWSNYNESDPGVTILEQLCYALTELGYCAQFSIEDVLTSRDGKIHYHDQFFEPQHILTCSPVTIDDYRRLVHDQFAEVRVIYIDAERVPDTGGAMCATGRYRSYISMKQSDQLNDEQVIDRVHVLLNRHRNLAELFLRPVMLNNRQISLAGRVCLTRLADAGIVHGQILQVIQNYSAPLAIQSGYGELKAEGFSTDQIFNGPELQHGWICGADALGCKCQRVSLFQLSSLILSVDGVSHVESLNFLGENGESEICIADTEIPDILLSDSFQFIRNNQIVAKAANQPMQQYFSELAAAHQSAGVEAKVDLYPELPQGKYRNIEQYVSVQNTFPDIYGVGYNSLQSDAESYRVASSRQLKGYLMVYDQLLANQFSQLAHIGDLYSFQQNHSGLRESGHAINHKPFETTYYCQALYDVPDVKPLLRGNDAFRYQFDPDLPDKKIEREAWKKFREFPFNEYIYGLQHSMESDAEAFIRRDGMLTHLMARHGDEAGRYDDMIRTCQWYGGEARTRIIVKSIWLQNYRKLSYYRSKAFDFNMANKLVLPGDPGIIPKIASRHAVVSGHAEWWRAQSYPTIDGELDQTLLYSAARLVNADFDDFSTFELKADILLGLSAHLRNLAGKLFALLDDSGFDAWLKGGDKTRFLLNDTDISVVRDGNADQVCEGQNSLMIIKSPEEMSSSPARVDYLAHAEQLLWLSTQRKGFLLIEPVLLLPTQKPNTPLTCEAAPYFLTATLIFPDYVALIQRPCFGSFIDTLRDLHWTAHLEMRYQPASFLFLKAFIPIFVRWHNSLRGSATRDNASAILAKLLKLPAFKETDHAN